MHRLNRHKNKRRPGILRGLLSAAIIMFFILIFNGDALSVSNSDSPGMADYTAFPPIGGTLLKPNILINLDTSYSMFYFAYDFNFNQATDSSGGGMSKCSDVPVSTGFNPDGPDAIAGTGDDIKYYGYFDPDHYYTYNGKEFIESSGDKSTRSKAVNEWDGNFMNWLTMRRVDIVKKALIGGKTYGRINDSSGHPNDLVAQRPWIHFEGCRKQVSNPGNYIPAAFVSSNPQIFSFNNDRGAHMTIPLTVNDVSAFSIAASYDGTDSYKVVMHRNDNEEPKGVIQRVGKNVRWGLEFISDQEQYTVPADCLCKVNTETYNGQGGGKNKTIPNVQGGKVVVPCGYNTVSDIVTKIANNLPLTPATPIAESLWTATGYFKQDTSAANSVGPNYTGLSYPVSDAADPYNYADNPAASKRRLSCAKSFVITITDGEPTQDQGIASSIITEDSIYTDDEGPVPRWADNTTTVSGYLLNSFWDQTYLKGSHYVDDVALYGRAAANSYRDLKPDNTNPDLPGEQYLTHYFIFLNLDGKGSPDARRLLNWPNTGTKSPNPVDPTDHPGAGGAARNGGFIDGNGNFLPDRQDEYDSDTDGDNDTFYEAKDGYQLEAALANAVYTAFKRASSGTAASLVVNTGDGEGAVYQAYFYPEKIENDGIRKWLGYIYALFVDKFGNLWDASGNIIRIDYSAANGIEVYKCADLNGDGQNISCNSSPEPDGLESIEPIWDGGRWLWGADPADRYIFTTTDGTTGIDFIDTANSSDLSELRAYLRADDNDNYQETKNIINWISGDDLTGKTDSGHPDGYRQRSITLTINGTTSTNVWKLGDIVYSSPTAVGRPMENYDLLYGDASYTKFRRSQVKRRQMVYAGANDGMLHAFNAGCYDETNHVIVNDCPIDNPNQPKPDTLGREIWAFIPRGLLPHLKWLTDPEYTHVYYVDLKPKITDVQIFDCSDHTGKNPVTGKCWGTILIGGFRYGGKKIDWTSGGEKYRTSPEYFALDITDPLKPKLLWTFSDPDLGLSMSYPAVAKIGNEWYAVFGSGATDYDATSDLTEFQNGNVFVLDISAGNYGVIKDTEWVEDKTFRKIPTNTPNTFMSNPITVDVDIDYDVDVIYIGGNYLDNNGNPNAIMYRITTDPVLSQWKLSSLGNINAIAGTRDDVKRITSAPSAAMDDMTNLWVYFGTGQFLGASDKNHTGTGAFYAIKDGCWDGTCAKAFSNLYDASDINICVGGNTCAAGSKFNVVESDAAKEDGWVLYFKQRGEAQDFTGRGIVRSGERSLSKPLVLGGLVTWGTYIPGIDECTSGSGENHAYSVYYKTGTAYKDYVFDEQKEQSNPSDIVARVKKLKITDPPRPPTAQISSKGTVNIYFPGGKTVISGIEGNTPFSVKSDVAGCMDEQVP